MKERAEIRPAHIMLRGEYDKPGPEVVEIHPDSFHRCGKVVQLQIGWI